MVLFPAVSHRHIQVALGIPALQNARLKSLFHGATVSDSPERRQFRYQRAMNGHNFSGYGNTLIFYHNFIQTILSRPTTSMSRFIRAIFFFFALRKNPLKRVSLKNQAIIRIYARMLDNNRELFELIVKC